MRALGTLRDRRGVTLVELMATIAILSTLLMMVVPGYTEFRRAMAMKWTARNAASALRLAQQKAAAANRPAHVDFDVDRSFVSAWADLDQDGAFDGAAEVRAVGLPSEGALDGVPGILLPLHTRLASTTFPKGARGVPSVTFASDGSVADPGEIVIADDWGRSYRIEVSLAGGVTILQKVGGQWVE